MLTRIPIRFIVDFLNNSTDLFFSERNHCDIMMTSCICPLTMHSLGILVGILVRILIGIFVRILSGILVGDQVKILVAFLLEFWSELSQKSSQLWYKWVHYIFWSLITKCSTSWRCFWKNFSCNSISAVRNQRNLNF